MTRDHVAGHDTRVGPAAIVAVNEHAAHGAPVVGHPSPSHVAHGAPVLSHPAVAAAHHAPAVAAAHHPAAFRG